VYVREFEEIGMSLIESATSETLLVIDEIGKMELFSERFKKFIENMLKPNQNLKVFATVPLKNPPSLIEQLKSNPKSQIFHVTKSNRDQIFSNVVQSLQNLMK
jgi:nucleoside-triphosphatase